MSYLITPDLKRLIQTDHLTQIIGTDQAVLNAAIEVSLTEAKSYLSAKYDVAAEFTSTALFVYGTKYYYNDRIYINAEGYNGSTNYTINMLCIHEGVVFRCLASTSGGFDPTKWAALGPQYAIFHLKAPVNHTPFDYLKAYNIDDKVIYKLRKYTALRASTFISDQEALEYISVENLPDTNVFPDASNGPTYWTNNGLHEVQNIWPTDTALWAASDNRNQQLVNCCVDIALYHVHSRIAPHNIPDLRVKRYDDAIAWLRRCAKGEDVTPNIPVLQPKSGRRLRYGGSVKNQNIY